MRQRDPVLPLVTALSAAVLGRRDPSEAASLARRFLPEALDAHRSVALEIRFTGFSVQGRVVGSGSAGLLRAAGRLILLGVSRLGFTSEAGEQDIRVLFELLSQSPQQLASRGGVVAALAQAGPYGIYVATRTEELYKPSLRPDAPSTRGEETGHALPDDGHTTPARSRGREFASTPSGPPRAEVGAPPDDEAIEGLIRSLAGAEGLEAFARVATEIADSAGGQLERGELAAAVPLLQALVEEAERTERGEDLRKAARERLEEALGGERSDAMVRAVARWAPGSREVIALLAGFGDRHQAAFEDLLLRSDHEELRQALFRGLLRSPASRERVLQRALREKELARARSIFSLAALPGLEEEVAHRFAEAAAAHPDPEIRQSGARAAGAIGGLLGVRILERMLSDRKRSVKLRVLAELGRLKHPASVPVLGALLEEGAEEEIEVAALQALGATEVPDAIPSLLAVLGRRQLFSGKRLQKRKLAAVRALGRIRDRRSREVLIHLAAGRDSALAAEAARALQGPSHAE